MKEFFNSRAGVKFTAILWTVCTAVWLMLCVLRIAAEVRSEGLIVLTAITTLLGVLNCVIQWTRYVNFEEENEESTGGNDHE